MPLHELADRTHVSVNTLIALEKGAPSVGTGILLRVLYILKLHEAFATLADPGCDAIGLAEEIRRAPSKIFGRRSLEDEL
jgi:transcriptional regulator with XRE-family HTH domain